MRPLTGAARNWLTPHGMNGTEHTGKQGRGGEFAAQATEWQTPASTPFTSPLLGQVTSTWDPRIGQLALRLQF